MSHSDDPEPRFQRLRSLDTPLIFGVDVDGLTPGAAAQVDAAALPLGLQVGLTARGSPAVATSISFNKIPWAPSGAATCYTVPRWPHKHCDSR